MKMNRERFEKILEKYYSHSPPTKFVLAVDFDHTLCYSHYPFCGKETPVATFVRSIQDMGIILIINTCREKGITALAAKNGLNAMVLNMIITIAMLLTIFYFMVIVEKLLVI